MEAILVKLNQSKSALTSRIFSRLGRSELLYIFELSPTIAEMAKGEIQSRYRNFYFQVGSNEYNSFDEVLRTFKHFGSFIRQLIIRDSNDSNECQLSEADFYRILRMCPNLIMLTIDFDFTDTGLPVPDLSTLQTINFESYELDEGVLGKLLSGCSTKLKILVFTETNITGECLLYAPMSVNEIHFNCALEDDTNIEDILQYTRRNPNLVSLEWTTDETSELDLAQVCANIPNLELLSLHCMHLANYASIATLKQLWLLNIHVKSHFFEDYPNALAADYNPHQQQLQSLEILIKVDVSPELARSFQHFKHLTFLQLVMDMEIVQNCQEVLLPTIGQLEKLEHVILYGQPMNFRLVCESLKQIKKLVTVVGNDIYGEVDPKQLVHMTRLEELDVTYDFIEDGNVNYSASINQLLVAIAASQSIVSAVVSEEGPSELYPATLAALQKAYGLQKLHLDGVFMFNDVIRILQNAKHLNEFRQLKFRDYVEKQIEELNKYPAYHHTKEEELTVEE